MGAPSNKVFGNQGEWYRRPQRGRVLFTNNDLRQVLTISRNLDHKRYRFGEAIIHFDDVVAAAGNRRASWKVLFTDVKTEAIAIGRGRTGADDHSKVFDRTNDTSPKALGQTGVSVPSSSRKSRFQDAFIDNSGATAKVKFTWVGDTVCVPINMGFDCTLFQFRAGNIIIEWVVSEYEKLPSLP